MLSFSIKNRKNQPSDFFELVVIVRYFYKILNHVLNSKINIKLVKSAENSPSGGIRFLMS